MKDIKTYIIVFLALIILFFAGSLIYTKNQKNEENLIKFKNKVEILQSSYKKTVIENKNLLNIIKKGFYGEIDSLVFKREIEKSIFKLTVQLEELDSLFEVDNVTDLTKYDNSKEKAFDNLMKNKEKQATYFIKQSNKKYSELMLKFNKLEKAFDFLKEQNLFLAAENSDLANNIGKLTISLTKTSDEINFLKKEKDRLNEALKNSVSKEDQKKIHNELNETNNNLIAAQEKVSKLQEGYNQLETKIGDLKIEFSIDESTWNVLDYGVKLKARKIKKIRISFNTLISNSVPQIIQMKIYKDNENPTFAKCEIENGSGSYIFRVNNTNSVYKIEVWNKDLTEKILTNPINISLKRGILNWIK